MNKCIKCGSYAFNLYKEDIDQGGLCDVHYWQGRAHRAEALAQPEQEPVAWITEWKGNFSEGKVLDYAVHARGGNVKYTPLYTTPPQRTWVGLTVEEIRHIYICTTGWSISDSDPMLVDFAEAIEAKLKQKNT